MSADEYRRLAAECRLIAEDTTDLQSKALLMHMSRAWLRLAERSEKDLPGRSPRLVTSEMAVVQQQQQQIQPKKKQ
jgi:hypothetical protein